MIGLFPANRVGDENGGWGLISIALATERANDQHYEVPSEFFEYILGPRLKYSCCQFETGKESLAEAESAMLDLTCQRAEIENGMTVLDLGCGWGSLTLWIAEKYPRCQITAVSNSHGQRLFIENRCLEMGVTNVRARTTNVAELHDVGAFDRIVSIEMFEHMHNYEKLFERISKWLQPWGKLFVHIFCHRTLAYFFETNRPDDWMSRHFFTGGIMPSMDLFNDFQRDLSVTKRWTVDGRHYSKTCEQWLRNLDSNRQAIFPLFTRNSNASEAKIVLQRWRMFMMACSELFGFRKGQVWLVGHYLLEHQSNDRDFGSRTS